MADKINPYIAGAPVVEQRMFFGREDVFSWIERSLSGKFVDHILVLHGQRRVGKTSVLKHLPNRLPERYIPIFIDLQGRVNTTLPRFLWWLAREISRALDMEKPARETFEDDPDFFESSFLPAVEEALGDNVLLLTFDEFDTLESTSAQEGLALPFMAILKRLMDHKKLNFIFSIGSSGRKLENMQAAYTNFFKQALYRKISFLSENDAHDLITRPVEGVLSFDLDAVDRIFTITSGHPYFVQLICHELFSVSQKTNDWQISKADVDAVLDAVIERGTVNLKFVWDESSELEKWVLAALAQFKDSIDLSKLEDFLNKQKVRFIHQDLESAVLHLREKDVLASGNRFVIYLLKLWLIQNRSIEQVREELARINPIVSRLLQVGHEYLDQGDYQKAIDAFSEALQSEEDNLEVRLGLSAAYMAREDYGRAAIEYEEILALYPEDVAAQSGYCDANLALGDVRFSLGRMDEAEYAYQQILKISPKHRDGRNRMANLFHHRAVTAITGNSNDALEHARKALEFSPENDTLQSIVSELEALINGKQDIKDVLFSWGERIRGQEDWEDALNLLSAYARIHGEDDDLAALLIDLREKARVVSLATLKTQAQRLQRLDAFDDAIFTYNQYLALDPDDAEDIPAIIQSLKEARKQAQREAGLTNARPLWKRPFAWVSLVVVAALATLMLIPNSPLRLAIAPPVPTQEIVERIVVATTVPTIAPTPTIAPLPYEWKRVTSAQFLERDFITALAIHPEDPDVIYAGMRYSGIFKTINGGISWFPVQEGLTRGWIKDIIIHPDEPDTVYASALYAGVYRTDNGGENWIRAKHSIEPNQFWQLTSDLFMNPADPDHIIYTCGFSAIETLDNGTSWQALNTYFPSDGSQQRSWAGIYEEIIIDPVTGNYFAIVNQEADSGNLLLFVSSDHGKTWQQSFEEIVTSRNMLNYEPVSEMLTMSAAIAGNDKASLFMSHDGGTSWNKSPYQDNVEKLFFSSQGSIYFFSRNTLNVSEDAGNTWKSIVLPQGENFGGFTLSVSASNPNRIIIGGESIFITNDGGTSWEERANGIGAALSSIGIGDSSEMIYVTEMKAHSDDSENTFYQYNLAENISSEVGQGYCGNTENIYAKAICPLRIDDEIFQPEDAVLETIYAHPSGRYYAPHGPSYYRSDNFGESWEGCTGINGWTIGMMKSSMAIHPIDPDIVFLASSSTGLKMSTDGCMTPIEYEGLNTNYVNGVTIHPENPDMVFVASDAGVYLSEDGGYTWGAINDGLLGALVVYEVVIDPNQPDDIYAVSSYGIFKLEGK